MARTWETRELPVLRAIEEREPLHGTRTLVGALAGDLDEEEVRETLRRLEDAGYVARDPGGSIAEVTYLLTERARVRLGQWPGDELAEAFLELLRQRAGATVDDGERRRLDSL